MHRRQFLTTSSLAAATALVPATVDSPRERPVDSSGDPGFDVRLAGKDVLVTHVDSASPAAAAGVRMGWRVVSVDGASISEAIDTLDASLPERVRVLEAWRAIKR